MRYFLINRFGPDIDDEEAHKAFLISLRKDSEAYRAYLISIKDRLPEGVYQFATADWHYNPNHPTCPHDAWIHEIKITERGKSQGRSTGPSRKIQIELVLVGAYHDRLLKLMYTDVISYSMTPSEHRSRGDWITDEISLSEAGHVVHQIQFADESQFRFECKDLRFEEQLTETPYTATWAE